MNHWLAYVTLLGLTTCCLGKIAEWELTLHHEIGGLRSSKGENELEGLPVVEPPYHSAGYLSLNNTHDAKLFYFYFQVGAFWEQWKGICIIAAEQWKRFERQIPFVNKQ